MPEKSIFKYVTAFAAGTPEHDLKEHTLLFTHIPKTAGTTFDHILLAVAKTQRIPFIRAMGKLYKQPNDGSKRNSLEDFAAWPSSVFERRCYLSGHLPFGTHQRLSRPYFYLTILRDPLARVLSEYRFSVQRQLWSETISIPQAVEMGMMPNNLQTRQIAGLTDLKTPCTGETLKVAIEHLRSDYTLVGTSDRFDDFLKQVITLLGWPDIAYGNRQVTPGSPSEDLKQQADEATRRFFSYDLELYAAAREIALQNAARAFKESPQGSRRQDRVVVCIPGTPVDGKETALMASQTFDKAFRPALLAHGGDVTFI